LVSAGVAAIAWWAGTLSKSGTAAAWTIGLLILYSTGWKGGAVLAAFFVCSNLVSRLAPRTNYPGVDAKGHRRDAWQVYANGGPAAVAAVVVGPDLSLKIWLVSAGLAAAAADTWATSIGAYSRVPPRLLWSGRQVAPGASGGITLAGSAGAVIGGALVAGAGAVATGMTVLLPVGTLIGFLGMLVDSAMGGALQGRFYCSHCSEPSEWRVHRCGSPTERKAGWVWLSNDGVNFVATALSCCAAGILWGWLD
jgi:uncharacterized protein (TIGR00297 family)